MSNRPHPTVLIVDDTKGNIDILLNVLDGKYDISVATNGPDAIRLAETTLPDLILLDIMMPGMNGYQVCEQLKKPEATRDIPIIFLTALTDLKSKTKGFDAGAVDYVTKPFDGQEVRARVSTHLALKHARELLANQNSFLEERVDERTREVALTQEVTIESLATLAETRDNETGRHIRRTGHYVRTLAERLRGVHEYEDLLTTENISLIYRSAALHDIGKVGVRDSILLKPGKLTHEEFEQMKTHTTIGRDALLKAERGLGTNSFLRFAREIAYGHHEKWDGSGYPQGLEGREIPVPARLMAIADVYDALTSKRVYKEAFSHAKAVEIILGDSGSHFDPKMVKVFQKSASDFLHIAEQFPDTNDPVNAQVGSS